MTQRAVLIYNPNAGQLWNPLRPEQVVGYLADYGWDVTLKPTQGPRDAEKLARAAVIDGVDLVIGAGGDGTLNEITQALAGTPVPLAILPAGTTNVVARELGIPLSISGALEIIPQGKPKAIDLGIANGRYFLFVCGLGFDAWVNKTANKELKRWTGFWAFFVKTFQSVAEHEPAYLRIQMRDPSGRERKLKRTVHQVMICNTETYGTGFKVATGARFDDGQMELCIIKGSRMSEFFWRSTRVLLWPFTDNKLDVEFIPVTDVYIRSRRPMAVQIDGEDFGTTPVDIGIRPLALHLWVPAGWQHPQEPDAEAG